MTTILIVFFFASISAGSENTLMNNRESGWGLKWDSGWGRGGSVQSDKDHNDVQTPEKVASDSVTKKTAEQDSPVTINTVASEPVFVAGAGAVFSNITEGEFDAIQSDPSNLVVGVVGFRAGADSGAGAIYEMFAGDNVNSVSHTEDIPGSFSSGVSYSYSVSFDASSDFSLTITPPSGVPVIVFTAPNVWFNTILISLEQNQGFPILTGTSMSGNNLDGNSFRNLETDSNPDWDGLEIVLPGYDSDNQSPFSITGTFVYTSAIGGGASGNEFRSKFALIQQDLDVTDPPSPAPAILTSATCISNQMVTTWQAATNGIWYIQDSHDLLNSNSWQDLSGPLSSTNGTVEHGVPVTNSPSFYRLIHRH